MEVFNTVDSSVHNPSSSPVNGLSPDSSSSLVNSNNSFFNRNRPSNKFAEAGQGQDPEDQNVQVPLAQTTGLASAHGVASPPTLEISALPGMPSAVAA